MRSFIMSCMLLSACSGCGERPLTFVSLNVANGFVDVSGNGPFRSPEARAAQAAFLRSQNADVIGLQEVDAGLVRSGGDNTARQIFNDMEGASTGEGTTLTLRTGTTLYAQACNVDPSTGAPAPGLTSASVGVALWVRQGLTVVENWEVPLSYGENDWPRVALFAHVVGEGHDFTVGVTHLSTKSVDIRVQEAKEATAFIPDVLLGDFNDLPDHEGTDADHATSLYNNPTYRTLREALAPLKLSTSDGCIDQVWHQPGMKVSGENVPTLGVSDHPYAARMVWHR